MCISRERDTMSDMVLWLLYLQHLPAVCGNRCNLYTGGLRKWHSHLDIMSIFLRQLRNKQYEE